MMGRKFWTIRSPDTDAVWGVEGPARLMMPQCLEPLRKICLCKSAITEGGGESPKFLFPASSLLYVSISDMLGQSEKTISIIILTHYSKHIEFSFGWQLSLKPAYETL